jgi:hypothetical protein
LIILGLALIVVGAGVAFLSTADIPAPRKTNEIPLSNDRLKR